MKNTSQKISKVIIAFIMSFIFSINAFASIYPSLDRLCYKFNQDGLYKLENSNYLEGINFTIKKSYLFPPSSSAKYVSPDELRSLLNKSYSQVISYAKTRRVQETRTLDDRGKKTYVLWLMADDALCTEIFFDYKTKKVIGYNFVEVYTGVSDEFYSMYVNEMSKNVKSASNGASVKSSAYRGENTNGNSYGYNYKGNTYNFTDKSKRKYVYDFYTETGHSDIGTDYLIALKYTVFINSTQWNNFNKK